MGQANTSGKDMKRVALATGRHTFEVNLFGLIARAKKCLPHMRGQRRGRVINVSRRRQL